MPVTLTLKQAHTMKVTYSDEELKELVATVADNQSILPEAVTLEDITDHITSEIDDGNMALVDLGDPSADNVEIIESVGALPTWETLLATDTAAVDDSDDGEMDEDEDEPDPSTEAKTDEI